MDYTRKSAYPHFTGAPKTVRYSVLLYLVLVLVLKYIFRVLVLVLVLESLVLVLVLVLVTKYLLPRRKFSYVVETLQV